MTLLAIKERRFSWSAKSRKLYPAGAPALPIILRQIAVTASTLHPVNHLENANWPRTGYLTAMAARISRSSVLASAFRPAKSSLQGQTGQVLRCLSTTSAQYVALPKDVKNMRMAPRDHIGTLEAPIVNPADKYQSKADNLHRYGAWLMGCMPKYIQQFSVWKDELTIYISPSGVIPVFSFLKCTAPIYSSCNIHQSLISSRQHRCRVHSMQHCYRRRLSHPRQPLRDCLQHALCTTQLSHSSEDLRRRGLTCAQHYQPIWRCQLVRARGV
jgi:hypothetical protein